MAIGFHLDDIEEEYFRDNLGCKSTYKEATTLSKVKTAKLRFPSCQKYREVVVREKGICQIWDELDQYGEVIRSIEKLILPKEVFIAAYNAYIKDGEYNG